MKAPFCKGLGLFFRPLKVAYEFAGRLEFNY